MPVCQIDGCDGKHLARGWCPKHYRRWRRYGDPLGGGPAPQPRPEVCQIDGCDRLHYARGWCEKHYQRWKKHGDPLGAPPRVCSIEGCDGKHKGRGWCEKHYRRWKTHGDLADPTPRVCSIEGCDGKHEARGWCEKHYDRWQAHGDPLTLLGPSAYPGDCLVCDSPRRAEVDRRLIGGSSATAIAQDLGVSPNTAVHHATAHLGIPLRSDPRCSICDHPDVDDIEDDLDATLRPNPRQGRAALGWAEVARRWDVPSDSLRNHMQPDHLARSATYEVERTQALRQLLVTDETRSVMQQRQPSAAAAARLRDGEMDAPTRDSSLIVPEG